MKSHLRELKRKLKDKRSKKVIFVSHCLLNENTRYLGGAFNCCFDKTLIDNIHKHGFGIVQMKCPEQRAWGGILKKYIWISVNSKNSLLYTGLKILFPLFLIYTKIIYKKIAKEIAKDIKDYTESDYEVVGIIGVDASPSCGVNSSLEMKKSFDFMAKLDINLIDRNVLNEKMYKNCLVKEKGIFIKEIDKILKRKKIEINYYSRDLVSEMHGHNSESLF